VRKIETHAVNGLNEALILTVLDEPGQGGACHQYLIQADESKVTLKDGVTVSCLIQFQNGPIKEHGVNGISGEVLLAVVRDRLECFQRGPFACDTNQQALDHVVAAMESLHSRTKERVVRGVEGTNVK
jgi:hypothetical protein